MIKELKEMMIVKFKTCDWSDPITHYEHNPHYEYYTILDIKKGKVKLFNLQNQNTIKQDEWVVKKFYEKGE